MLQLNPKNIYFVEYNKIVLILFYLFINIILAFKSKARIQ